MTYKRGKIRMTVIFLDRALEHEHEHEHRGVAI